MDLKTVERIATLARISLNDQEKAGFLKDLNRIFEFISHLEEVNTDDVEPLVSVAVDQMPLRQDEVTQGDLHQAVLQNAPQKVQNMFAVPKVLE